MFTEYLESLMTRDNKAKGDFQDSEGYWCCGVCKTRKQYDVDWLGTIRRVPIPCKCDIDQEKAQKEARIKAELEGRMTACDKYNGMTFENDDGSNPKITKVCKEYIDEWGKMLENNIGILFCGNVGTGKTYLACCIAHALIDKLVSAEIINLPTVLNAKYGEQNDIINHIMGFDLLVIDDLGVERNSPYANEQVYNIINGRWLTGKPLIITTNLTIEEIENETDRAKKRIYDRITEMCPVRIAMTGESKRAGVASERRKIAERLLKK